MKVLERYEIEQVSGGAPNECVAAAIFVAGGVAALAIGSAFALPYSIPLVLRVTAAAIAPGGLAFVAYNVVAPEACTNAGVTYQEIPDVYYGGCGGSAGCCNFLHLTE